MSVQQEAEALVRLNGLRAPQLLVDRAIRAIRADDDIEIVRVESLIQAVGRVLDAQS